MTEQEAIRLVDELRAGYPAVKLAPETLRMWVRGLQAMRHDVATAAVRSMIEHEKWPTVADLHKHYSIAAAQHRRRVEEERTRLERLAEDNMELPELQSIPAVREHLARIRAGDLDAQLNLEQVDDGPCNDCKKPGARFKLGPGGFCSSCVASRLRAQAQIESAA